MTSRREILREYTEKYEKVCREVDNVDIDVYEEFGVKRGLRDKNGSGVLTGVTNISRIDAFEMKVLKRLRISFSSESFRPMRSLKSLKICCPW